MATCRFCNKSGWFLKTSEDGLCQLCHFAWSTDLDQHGRIIKESIRIAKNSRNLKTRLSRIGVAIASCRELRKYELRRIPTITTPPSAAIKELNRGKRQLIHDTIEEELVKARTKSQNAPTAASKVSPFQKVIERIGELYSEIDDVTELEKLEQVTRVEMDRARLSVELEKAEKAEFKGQKKKALDAYLDALFVIRKDTIPDSEQAQEIGQIESKIAALGGEVPAS